MALLRRCYAKLRLKVNEAKSAVSSITGRKFPGYSFWFARDGVKRRVAAKPLATFRQRVRQLTRRSGGRGMVEVIERLRPYLLGRKAYFGLAQTPGIWRSLGEWLRHRLGAFNSSTGSAARPRIGNCAHSERRRDWRGRWLPIRAVGGATAQVC